MSRSPTDPQAQEAEILDAAARAFMEHGYAATSLDTVADVLGATKGRIYYYYKSKADLFYGVHSRAMKLNIETIEPLSHGPGTPLARLTAMVRAHALLIMTSLPYQRIAVQGVEMHLTRGTTPAQRKLIKSVVEMRDRYENLFLEVIGAGVAAGELAAHEPRFAVKPLLGALNWMTTWYRPRAADSDATRDAVAAQMVAVLLDGMRVRPPPARQTA